MGAQPSAPAPPPPLSVAAVRDEATLLISSFGSDANALASREPDRALDGAVFGLFVLIILVLSWGLRWCVLDRLATRLLGGAGMARQPRPFRNLVTKFSQAIIEFVIYASFTALGCLVVPSQPWIWPSKHWWIGFSTGSHASMRDDLRCYYLLYGARYVAGFISVYFEPRRKDYVEMQLHHVVTVAVVAISYLYGWNRIGCVVMLLLDPADVPLHAAKMCKYVADARGSRQPTLAKRCTFCADRVFELFAVVFLATRVLAYPYVCWSAHVEATRYFPKGAPEWTCVGLLWTLYALQCYWFFLIINVAIRMAVHGKAEDVRSDSEGEDDHES
mmetsp:Transcript_26561/g.81677  ORF Transcript_26561/g.81677 Transcript_26561/m.81677 type:complete len:331 (+) Transcript_26561:952-1944(+)